MSAQLSGLAIATRLVLRRNWLRMLVWALVLGVLVVMVIAYQAQTFPDQAARDAYAQIANTPAVAALTGLPYAAATTGGILNIKLWMSGAITLALVCVFLVTRNGRAEEESGRLELLRAAGLGRLALPAAGWLLTAAFAVAAGLLSGLAAVAMGLPVAGSLLMGLSWSGLGIAFAGVAAFTGQLAATGRAATAWASVVLAAAFLVRVAADLNADGETPAWFTWFSPVGWAQQTRSFGEDQWWALLPLLALGLIGIAVACAIGRTRDLGAGIVAPRPGRASASPLTRTVLGLPLRLQRAAILSWLLGTAVAGLFLGGVATAMSNVLDGLGSSPIAQALTGGADSQMDGLLGFLLVFLAVLVTAFAVQSTLALRADEAAGFAELEWTATVSRWAWGLARLAVPAVCAALMLLVGGLAMGAAYGGQIGDPSQLGRFAVGALAYWPPLALVMAVTAAACALLPRAATGIAWTVYGLVVLFAALGDVLGLPHEVVEATPFWAVPQPGRPDPAWGPVWLMASAAILVSALALWRLRSRDEATA
ncbi:ABC transporter permease [Leucobacter massiliensis]|uniref:Polyketide antibiotic transporter n=1 Tax=Leucobacter massiliensis TaxID=1686285 RepID=A0A2S9QR43_9MICO|nr:ABC transporter permease [Leucobacter massiliensis]PRI12048.1 hypothetical protein B4915_03000 [Leucobacter massiliensis]